MLYFLEAKRVFPSGVIPLEALLDAAILTSSIDVIALRRLPVLDWKMFICTELTGLTPPHWDLLDLSEVTMTPALPCLAKVLL